MDNNFTIRKLTPEEQNNLNTVFFEDYLYTLGNLETIYKPWFEFFMHAPLVQIQEYRGDFWKWFVFATWRILNSIPEEDMIRVLAHQAVDASVLGINVINEVQFYLIKNTHDEKSLKDLYTKFRRAVLDSKMILGKSGQEQYAVPQLIEDLDKLDVSAVDSIESAKFFAKLKQILFAPIGFDSNETGISEEESLFALTNTFVFFKAIDHTTIAGVIDFYMKSEDQIAAMSSSDRAEKNNDVNSTPISSAKPIAKQSTAPATPVKENVAKKSPAKIKTFKESVSKKPNTTKKKKLDYNRLIKEVSKRFATDKDKQIKDIEGVMKVLNALATDYKDDTIRELYYFDEKSGLFKWRTKK